MNFLTAIRSEFKTFEVREKLFIFFSMLSGFLIAAEYGITRPASQSLFLSAFSSHAFPWVWLSTVPLNFLVIYFYNRFLPKIGPLKMFAVFASAAILINSLSALLLPFFPKLIFLQFAWKDIYILLMFKQLWSMIHSTISSSRAKYLYGIIFGVGTLGSILGSLIPGFFAETLGSESILLFTLPIYGVLFFAYKNAHERSFLPKETFSRELSSNPSPLEGVSLIWKNRFLALVLFLVIFMQASVALLEYQFNVHLEMSILEKDLRTAYCGRLIGITNILSALFQVGGSFLMIQFFGVKRSHFLIPIMLLSSALSSWALPTFAMISCSYVFLKSIDFSLFNVMREMLYIPLQLDEKFRAKAVIDVFAYRTSKAFVSLAILFLQAIAGSYLLDAARFASFAVFIGWMGVLFFLFKKQTSPEAIR